VLGWWRGTVLLAVCTGSDEKCDVFSQAVPSDSLLVEDTYRSIYSVMTDGVVVHCPDLVEARVREVVDVAFVVLGRDEICRPGRRRGDWIGIL